MRQKITLSWLLLMLSNVWCFAFTDSTYIAEFVIPLLNAEDDTEQRGDGTIYFGSTDIELVYDPDNGNQTIGLHFQNIPFAQNAIIAEAYIQFNADETNSGNCNIYFNIEDSNDASPFVDDFQNISNRVLTNDTINWNPPAWNTINQAQEAQRSPDLSLLLQQIIDRPDWVLGNAVNFIISGTGSRVATAYELDPQNSAKLIVKVEYPLANAPVSNLWINEIMPLNGVFNDEYGEPDDWIELYNGGSESIHLGGLYLSDDPDSLQKWQITAPIDIAPNNYVQIWADGTPEQGGLHASFKLKSEGETVFLSQIQNGNLVIIDEVSYEACALNFSYGRKQDGSDDWILFGEATPGSSNNDSGFFLDEVMLSLEPGIYQGTQTVNMTGPIPGTTIFYTTDGSVPHEDDLLFTNPINVEVTKTIRARAYKNEYAPGKISTATYIINSGHDIPIFSLVTDPNNLWSDQDGIYVEGTNGIPGWCVEDPVNWNQDWERPATITMYEPDGRLAFQKRGGIKIGGGCSRSQAQKSFNIYLRPNTYGDSPIEYEIFSGLDINKFQRLKLRDGGQDFGSMMIRDGLNQSLLWGQVDLDQMAYRPAALYINGEYWGLYGIRELYSKHHLINHYEVEEENIDMLVNPYLPWGEIKQGDKVAFNALFNYINSNDLSNTGSYDYVDSQIDTEEFLNYQIAQIYIANFDWPSNNVVVWKPRDGGKWRWMLFDTDASTNFPLWGATHPDFNSMEFATSATSNDWPNDARSTLFLRKLLENSNFKNEFIQRTCTFSDLIYSPERVDFFTDSLAGLVESEMPRQIAKWGNWNDYGWGITAHGNINEWRNDLQGFKSFFQQRRTFMRNHLKVYFNLGERDSLLINHTSDSHGEVYFHSNEMKVPYQYQGEYFYTVPIKIKAIADPGYTFYKWEETGNTNAEINYLLDGSKTLTPVFIRNNIVLTEIHFNPEGGDDYEFIELYNPTNSNLDLSNFRVSESINFTFPEGSIFPANDYLLLVKNEDHFENENCLVFEWDSGNLNNQEGIIILKNSLGENAIDFSYNESFSYYEEALEHQQSLHLLDLSLDFEKGENWIALNPTPCAQGMEYIQYESEYLLMDIYPNPASGQINVSYAHAEAGSMILSIYNGFGQLIQQEQLRTEAFQKTATLTIDGLSAGIYIFQMKRGNEQMVEKVVIY